MTVSYRSLGRLLTHFNLPIDGEKHTLPLPDIYDCTLLQQQQQHPQTPTSALANTLGQAIKEMLFYHARKRAAILTPNLPDALDLVFRGGGVKLYDHNMIPIITSQHPIYHQQGDDLVLLPTPFPINQTRFNNSRPQRPICALLISPYLAKLLPEDKVNHLLNITKVGVLTYSFILDSIAAGRRLSLEKYFGRAGIYHSKK